MQSNIINLPGARVDQLGSTGLLMSMVANGTLQNGNVVFNLDSSRLYQINRMKINVISFNSNIPVRYAFPNYEQFALSFYVTGCILDSASNTTTTLFKNMLCSITDGNVGVYSFEEPYIFQSLISPGSKLRLVFQDTGDSHIINLTGILVPPVAGVINVNAAVTLEGWSLPATVGTKLLKEANGRY